MLVLGVVLAGTAAMVVRLRCADAAGEAARLAARGDDLRARGVAATLPAGTEVSLEVSGDQVRVRVRAPPLGAGLPGLRVGAEAVAVREPAEAGPDPASTPTDPAGSGADGGP